MDPPRRIQRPRSRAHRCCDPIEERSAAGIRIPLQKRGSLTNADGTFNREKAIISTAKTINKHRANLLNLEKNVGRQAFNEGAEIKPSPSFRA
ncbi:hypothetical protein NUW54_g13149 [Trametes sanguinea]|uniref:Uncharacterized protein n=1 Tax=Trametes sanguinea TaxID=158606 RepID=A0ACC1MQP4_9APHY|nr:hypothetical protein NUW54_g13149 [Trametes sanguinea]